MKDEFKRLRFCFTVMPIILLVFFLLSSVSYSETKQKAVTPPKNLNEAFELLDSALSRRDRESLRDCKRTDLIRYHFGLGGWIRNNFGLWAGNPKLYEAVGAKPTEHPDNVSGIIMRAYWEYLNRDIVDPELKKLSSDEYYQGVLSHLNRAYLSKSTRMTNFLPEWVFANSRRGIKRSLAKHIDVAKKLVAQDNSIACLALLFLAEYEKDQERIALLEEFLRKKEPTILYPLRVEEDPYFSSMLTGEDIAQKFDIEGKWTESIAVGNDRFIDKVSEGLGIRAAGRGAVENADGYELREQGSSYRTSFDIKNGPLNVKNTYFWKVISDISR